MTYVYTSLRSLTHLPEITLNRERRGAVWPGEDGRKHIQNLEREEQISISGKDLIPYLSFLLCL